MTPVDRPPTRRRGPGARRGRRRKGTAQVDRLDEAILSALQTDGRASLRRVAREVGASVTTVSARVRGLERLGVLQGFVPLLSVQRLSAIGRSPHCTVLRVQPRACDAGGLARLAHRIAEIPSVCYLFELNDSAEFMALASTGSRAETGALLRSLRRIPGIARVRPTPIRRVHKERPNHPVGAGEPLGGRSVDASLPA